MSDRQYPCVARNASEIREVFRSIQEAHLMGVYTIEQRDAACCETAAQYLMYCLDNGHPLPTMRNFGPSIKHLDRLYLLPPYVRAKQ